MKKFAITLSTAAVICSAMSVYAEPLSMHSPIEARPTTAIEQTTTNNNELLAECPTKDCDKKNECKKECETPPVFDSCTEIQDWKIKFAEKRCKVYTQLGLTQEQRVKAKTIDEKFFDEIAPLKMCCKQAKAKLKELECQKCSTCEKRELKEKIKDLKSEIKDKKKQHRECFEKILNDCQKAQYKKLAKDKKCGC